MARLVSTHYFPDCRTPVQFSGNWLWPLVRAGGSSCDRKVTAPVPLVEEYEPRLLYSADFAPIGLALTSNPQVMEQRFLDDSGEFAQLSSLQATEQSQELLIVDSNVGDIETLLAGLDTAGRNIEILFLEPDQNGVDQISAALAGHHNLTAVHILSHGTDGGLQLGSTILDYTRIEARSAEIARWGDALTEGADILLYGCDVAASPTGETFIQRLVSLTRADVTASNNLTGNSALGGDWNLEFEAGSIETGLAFTVSARGQWLGTFANTAPVLSGANNLSAINEDPVSNPGTLVSALIAGQVTDPDPGALGGIAVTAVDNTNGTWQFSTNGGSTWTAFGSPSVATSRLLAADASTYVRFVPNVDWNGTVINGITFRAWDQTSGTAGGAADTSTINNGSVRDEFSAVSYTNNNGTAAWSIGWVDVDGDPAGGNIQVTGGQLALTVNINTDSIYRQADLSGATSATLSFSYSNLLTLLNLGSITLQISNNGGGSYTNLATFSSLSNTGSGMNSIDISAYIANNTRIRFAITGLSLLNESVSFDNIELSYATAFSSATARSSITVNAVNDAPAGANNTVTLLEDANHVFSAAEFGFSDTIDANALLAVKITTLPGAGTLAVTGGPALNAGDFVALADITAGKLVFTPATNASGTAYAAFTFQVQDNGGTANSGVDLDPTPRTMTLNVTAVNDAPAGAPDTALIAEDSATVTGNVLANDSDVDATPVPDTLTVAQVNGASGNVGVAVGGSHGDLTLSANGSYSYALNNTLPAVQALATGSTLTEVFSYQVSDGNGGTAASTLTITITGANDAPVMTANAGATLSESASLTLTNAMLQASDIDHSAMQLTYTLNAVPANGTLRLAGLALGISDTFTQADIDTGKLSYSHGDSETTADSFIFTVNDADGLNVGPARFTLAIIPINDPPTASGSIVTITGDIAYVFSLGDFGYVDAEGDSLLKIRIPTLPAVGVLTLDGVEVTANQEILANDIASGKFKFQPLSGAVSVISDSFMFQVHDGTVYSTASYTLAVYAIPIAVPTVGVIPAQNVFIPSPAPNPAGAPLPSAAADEAAATSGSSLNSLVIPDRNPATVNLLATDELRQSTGASDDSRENTQSGNRGPNYGVSPASFREQPGMLLNLQNVSQANFLAVESTMAATRNSAFIDALDRLRDSAKAQAELETRIVGSAVAVGAGMSVGYVIWLLRGGVLLTSLLSSLPAWRFIDPLPVLARLKEDDPEEDDDESLESIVGYSVDDPPVKPEKSIG